MLLLFLLVFACIFILSMHFIRVFDPFEARRVQELKIAGRIKTIRYEDIVDEEGWVLWMQGAPRLARFYWAPGKTEDEAWEFHSQRKLENKEVFENQGLIWLRIKLGLMRKPVSTFRYIS